MKKMITRRQFMAAAGVVAAASALTACGGSSASTAASSAAGSTAGSAAASGSTIKVGVMGPLTGDASVYGLAVVNGASLYMKQVNADGGVNGKQLEIITMDEQGDATQAVTCFTKMVDQGITALVGDVTTTPTLAVAAESADYNMPMVTASATAEAVTYDAETDTVGLNVPFLGGDGWDGLEGYATADQLKDAYFCANYAKGSNPDFENAYKAEYGEEYPNGFAPLGYDAAMTVVYGIKAAEEQGLEAGSDEYKQAVIDAIAGGTIEGITGTFTFDEHHNPVKQTAILCFDGATPVLKEMF